jgi:hypothetical protein
MTELPLFHAKLVSVGHKVMGNKYIEVMAGKKVFTDKFDTYAEVITKAGAAVCVMKFHLTRLRIPIFTVNKLKSAFVDGSEMKIEVESASAVPSFLSSMFTNNQSLTAIFQRNPQGNFWKCGNSSSNSNNNLILLDNVMNNDTKKVMPRLPMNVCREASITLLRTLIEISTDKNDDKSFTNSLLDSTWNKLKEVKFLPVSSPGASALKVADASHVTSPRNFRLCFTVLRTLPRDILQSLIGTNKLNKANNKYDKTFGLLGTAHQNLAKEKMLYEIYDDSLSNLFAKLGVNTDINANVLVDHVINVGGKTEKWVRAFNQVLKDKSSIETPSNSSNYSSGQLSKERKSKRFSMSNALSMKQVEEDLEKEKKKEELAKKNKFKLVTKKVIEQYVVPKQPFPEMMMTTTVHEMDDDIEDFGDMSLQERQDKLHELKSSVDQAHMELGTQLLIYQKTDTNKFNDLKNRLCSGLKDKSFIWVTVTSTKSEYNSSGGYGYGTLTHIKEIVKCVAMKATSVFYKFDFSNSWMLT